MWFFFVRGLFRSSEGCVTEQATREACLLCKLPWQLVCPVHRLVRKATWRVLLSPPVVARTINKPHLVLKRQVLASFPGHSKILSCSHGENSTELQDKIWEWPGNEARQVQLRVIHCTGHVPTKTLVPYTIAMLDTSRAQEVMDVTKLDLGYISHTHVQYKPVIFTGNHSKLSVN